MYHRCPTHFERIMNMDSIRGYCSTGGGNKVEGSSNRRSRSEAWQNPDIEENFNSSGGWMTVQKQSRRKRSKDRRSDHSLKLIHLFCNTRTIASSTPVYLSSASDGSSDRIQWKDAKPVDKPPTGSLSQVPNNYPA
jgi:hypothetical protein